MYDPPGYLRAITIAGIIAIPAATCVLLYGGAARANIPSLSALARAPRTPRPAAAPLTAVAS